MERGCHTTSFHVVWPSPRQTPGPSCPYPSDRPPSGHRSSRGQARHARIPQIGLRLAIPQADANSCTVEYFSSQNCVFSHFRPQSPRLVARPVDFFTFVLFRRDERSTFGHLDIWLVMVSFCCLRCTSPCAGHLIQAC